MTLSMFASHPFFILKFILSCNNCYFAVGIVLDLDQEIIPVRRFLDKITPLDLQLQTAKKVNLIYHVSFQI